MSIAELQALDLISRLPDNVPLTVEEAAIFLRMSPSTLNKMRMPGHPTGGKTKPSLKSWMNRTQSFMARRS